MFRYIITVPIHIATLVLFVASKVCEWVGYDKGFTKIRKLMAKLDAKAAEIEGRE